MEVALVQVDRLAVEAACDLAKKAKQDAKGAPADTDESLATKVALRKRADAKVPVTADCPMPTQHASPA